jgi:hypothetical protein
MKRNITNTALTLSFLLFGGFAAFAQIDDGTLIKANIPFSFVVRDKTLPAGDYLIKRTDDGADATTVLELTSADKGRHESIVFETNPVEVGTPPKESDLVFDKVGDTYFLSEIWAAGEYGGNQLEESKTERAMMNDKHERVAVKVDHGNIVATVKR